MGERRIHITIHATERALRYGLDPHEIEKIILEGERTPEGRRKARYMLRIKKSVYIAICAESPEKIVVKTVTRGR